MTTASGTYALDQPASFMRRHQSTSSLNMKNASSIPPTASIASRRTSRHAPDSQSTSRDDRWSQSVIR